MIMIIIMVIMMMIVTQTLSVFCLVKSYTNAMKQVMLFSQFKMRKLRHRKFK